MSFGFNQKVTYWAAGGNDGYGGVNYGAPVVLDARWEQVQEQFLSPQQEIELSNAIVFFPSGTSVDAKGYLFLGQSVAATPAGLEDAYEIRRVLITPDLRSCTNEVRVIL